MNKYNPDNIELKYLTPNKSLLKSKQITKEYEQVLVDTYKQLTLVLTRPDMYTNPVEHIEALEYTLQVLWGFEPDKRQHTYWSKIKGCTCSFLDNMELVGTDMRWYSEDCKWHNGEV